MQPSSSHIECKSATSCSHSYDTVPRGDARERHQDIIEAIAIMLDTCSRIQELAAWDYWTHAVAHKNWEHGTNDEQRATVKSRFSVLAAGGASATATAYIPYASAPWLAPTCHGPRRAQLTLCKLDGCSAWRCGRTAINSKRNWNSYASHAGGRTPFRKLRCCLKK